MDKPLKLFARLKQAVFPSQYLSFLYPASWSAQGKADMQSFADKGYSSNVSVFSAIKQVTTKCASIPWRLYRVTNTTKFHHFKSLEKQSKLGWQTMARKDEALEADDSHPINELLWQPNGVQSWTEFVESVIAFKHVMGNAFIYGATPKEGLNVKRIQALYPWNPLKVTVEAPEFPAPVTDYLYNGRDRIPPENVLHLKYFNPEVETERVGLSPIEVIIQQVMQTNSYGQWNTSLVRNMGTQPGILKVKTTKLSKDKRKDIEAQFQSGQAGEYRAGIPIITDGDLDWLPIGFTPKDIEWVNGFKLAANQIALAFEIPPELLGDSEHKTYNSMPEAIRYFYYGKIIPEMDSLRDGLNRWLIPAWEESKGKLWLDYNLEDIEILQEERSAVVERVTKLWTTGLVTMNQALAKLGEPEIGPEGEIRLLPLGAQPMAPGELLGGGTTEEQVAKAIEFLEAHGLPEFGGNGHEEAIIGPIKDSPQRRDDRRTAASQRIEVNLSEIKLPSIEIPIDVKLEPAPVTVESPKVEVHPPEVNVTVEAPKSKGQSIRVVDEHGKLVRTLEVGPRKEA
jgi:HK97 family phage portal protein